MTPLRLPLHTNQSEKWQQRQEVCFVMINSPADSRRCLCHRVELSVAMSHYPHPANGRTRQIIHLPWWWHDASQVSSGEDWTACQSEDGEGEIRKIRYSSNCQTLNGLYRTAVKRFIISKSWLINIMTCISHLPFSFIVSSKLWFCEEYIHTYI